MEISTCTIDFLLSVIFIKSLVRSKSAIVKRVTKKSAALFRVVAKVTTRITPFKMIPRAQLNSVCKEY